MSRLLLSALHLAGHDVEVISGLRSFSRHPDPDRLIAMDQAAKRQIEAILARWADDSCSPRIWITYHPYYKTPDLIGPAIAATLNLAYVTIEASHAAKRSRDEWRPWQARVEQSLDMAALNIAITGRDREGLERYLHSNKRVATLRPFIDATNVAAKAKRDSSPVELVTVAMMRSGDKLRSYEFLAEALLTLTSLDWRLSIIGDGPARAAVERAFQPLPADRLTWHGELSRDEVTARLSDADLYVWPGFNEAYGLAYLEAQAAGLPVVALDVGGVTDVVQNGRTGLLANAGGLAAEAIERYRSALMTMITDQALRGKYADAAAAFVRSERTLETAASRVDALLRNALLHQNNACA